MPGEEVAREEWTWSLWRSTLVWKTAGLPLLE
jgi:hypothetical protein